MEPSLGYTGAIITGYNLWPYKLVTRIFEDAQAAAAERENVELVLHTKTPVTGFERIRDVSQTQQRRWRLQTPRGFISCNYVVHATNGYAGHLLPFIAGQGPAEGDSDDDVCQRTSSNGTDSEAATSPQIEELQYPLPQSSQHIILKPKPRGMYGIIPTRGQVGAVRASVPARDLGWRNSWVGGRFGGGLEYWFPRYQGLESTNESAVHGIMNETGTRNEKNPLIILGGCRQHAGSNMESGETNDGVVNERVSRALRGFLPHWFPGKFEGGGQGDDGWEMEWASNLFHL